MHPDVSVVIPTYNRRALLEQAIASCFAGNEALDIEVVVVDDGSSDGTQGFLRTLGDERVRPFFQSNQGPAVAHNRGMSEMRGAYVKFLDDDDWLMEGALVEEIEALEQSGADISYGDLLFRESDGEERVFRQSAAFDLAAEVFTKRIQTHPHVFVYRREALTGARWYPSLPFEQDYSFAIERATQGARAVHVGRVVGCFNQHDGARVTTTVKANTSDVKTYLLRILLIEHGVRRLEERGLLRPHHRRAAARGMWRWAYMMAPSNFKVFKRCCRRIQNVAPGFRPPRTSRLLRTLDRVASPTVTERVTYPLRRAKQLLAR